LSKKRIEKNIYLKLKNMRLVKRMKKEGSILFKYRGQIPILLFLISFPLIEQTSLYPCLSLKYLNTIQYIGVTISFFGVILRFYTIGTTPDGTSGRNRNYQIAEHLNKTGIYSIVRHPLYLANFIIWFGISVYSLSYILVLIISMFFLILYERIILTEENYLIEKYSSEFTSYSQDTPVFLPSFGKFKKSNNKLSIKKILKQEYSSTLSTVLSFIYIDILLKYFFTNHLQEIEIITHNHVFISVVFIMIAITLKTLKNFKII
tara:strand:- start:19443 stop:20228 length:786 start_codon:yes stop_codon:yes gene_type:complete